VSERRRRPRLAVWKFASCDGCQLSLLDCEDELLPLAHRVRLVYFKEATSTALRGPYDLSLVDGSISTPQQVERIHAIRRASRRLVTLGACATAGGIQALRNFADAGRYLSTVYPRPEYVATLATSTAISEHVPVDFELRGCPVDKRQLLEVISALLHGRAPQIPSHSVCVECKLRGTPCVMVRGVPCLGPVTHAGCGALCPAYDRGCYGCYGPMETPNTASLSRAFRGYHVAEDALVRVWRTFNANAPEFRRAAREVEEIEGQT
jgi:sulfhydrogenase subunit delta